MDMKLVPCTEEEMAFTSIEGLEEWREYDFGAGRIYRIEKPVKLSVKRKPEGDSHRLIDAAGTRHYVPAGWTGFRFAGQWGRRAATT